MSELCALCDPCLDRFAFEISRLRDKTDSIIFALTPYGLNPPRFRRVALRDLRASVANPPLPDSFFLFRRPRLRVARKNVSAGRQIALRPTAA